MRKKILFFISFLAVIFVTAFSSCKKTETVNPTSGVLTEVSSEYPQTGTAFTEISTENETDYTEAQNTPQTSAAQTEQAQKNDETQKSSLTTVNSNAEQETQSQNIPAVEQESTSSKYTRTGESVFTDDKNNKYLDAVSKKYNLDADTLVAIYTIPDANGNIVLEFDGSKDENGKPVRNEKTLVAIYSIDKEFNSKRASEDSSLNEYSDIEMKTMFFTVNKYLIPKFENELNG